MRHRRGSLLLETTLAVTLLVTAFVGVAQLLTIASRQQRETRWRHVAVREVGNVMEQASRLPWNQLTAASLSSLTLSEAARQTLPDAQLSVFVANDPNQPAARRITVQLDWLDLAGMRVQPIELVGWRFPSGEQRP